jgi:hypothetical protein
MSVFDINKIIADEAGLSVAGSVDDMAQSCHPGSSGCMLAVRAACFAANLFSYSEPSG